MRWLKRLLGSFGGDNGEKAWRDEVDSHLAMQVEDFKRSGMPEAEAVRAARLKFGSMQAISEAYRDQRGLPVVDMLRQDTRYGLRVLRNNLSLSATAILTLALGIGATTAIFSILHGVLLKPLPYRDPDRIVAVWQFNQKSARNERVAYANFADWRSQSTSFSAMGIAEPFSHEITGEGEPEAIESWLVSQDFLSAAGATFVLGRGFTADDFRQPANAESPSAESVIITHGFWTRRFGADPSLLHRTIQLRGRAAAVVGVLAPGFELPARRDLLAPRIESRADTLDRVRNFRFVIARLKPGVTLESAGKDLAAVSARLSAEYPRTNENVGAAVVPLRQQLTGEVRPALFVLAGSVVFVLLIACANVANLMLAHGACRVREFAVRRAMGASNGRLVRQLLTECGLLALTGAGLGWIVAVAILAWVRGFGPASVPRLDQLELDLRLVLIALGIGAATTLLFGLAPALASRVPDYGLLRSRSNRESWIRPVLLTTQISLALTLLTGAGLLVRSFVLLTANHPGFSAERILTLEAHIWKRAVSAEARRVFVERAIDNIRTIPGVTEAAAVSALPFHPKAIDIDATIFTRDDPGSPHTTGYTIVTGGYFHAMNIPIRRGRAFGVFDTAHSRRVVIVNDAAAAAFWPGSDPVGQSIRTTAFGGFECEVVGIAGATRHSGLDESPRPEIFFPHTQQPTGSITFIAKTAVAPEPMIDAIKRQVWSVDPNQPFPRIATLETLVDNSIRERRFYLTLLGGFALLALGLAVVGIYGVVSFSTRRRTPEIGLRVALGASNARILALVAGSSLTHALAGIGIGLGASALLARSLRTMLYGVPTHDPAAYAAAVALLLLAAVTAAIPPALAALRIDPTAALRTE